MHDFENSHATSTMMSAFPPSLSFWSCCKARHSFNNLPNDGTHTAVVIVVIANRDGRNVVLQIFKAAMAPRRGGPKAA
jgi:hypothetical protein